MSNTEKELKACPFCDGEAEVYKASNEYGDTWDEVVCKSCDTMATSIAAWNQRPASPLAEENKRLKEALEDIARGPLQEPMSFDVYARRVAKNALADTVAQAEPIGEREGE